MRDHVFTRTRKLIGQDALEQLQCSSILVIGIGGVGSFAAEALARSGIGSITLVDPEVIEASNINRQIHALLSTVGEYKVEVMAERIKDIHPDILISAKPIAFNENTACDILQPGFNYVVDCIDTIPEKIHLIKNCLKEKIPIISSMGAANRIQPLQLKTADISQTKNCPMAKKIRKELRKNHIYQGLEVVYSEEPPVKNIEMQSSALGSISFLPSVVGMIMASVVVNNLIKKAGFQNIP